MIHSSVTIEDGAIIAPDVVIGPFCHIGKDVVLESGCRLESNIILKGKIHAQTNVKIFSFAVIGKDDSDIFIGKNTHIREFTQIGSQDDDNKIVKKIIIGEDNFIMAYVQILSGVELSQNCILTNAVILYENVKCEEKVIVGGLSSVTANNKIGTGVMIGGASFVNQDIPPFTLVEGNHATIKGLNIIGLRRRVENKDDIEDIKAIYKKILGEGVANKELANEIALNNENQYIKRFASFIASSNL